MAEGPGGGAAKLGERFMEGVPGFAVVAIIVGALLPIILAAGAETAPEAGAHGIVKEVIPVIALVLAWAGYFLGHYLDDVLFDPIWGTPGIRNRSKILQKVLFFTRLDSARTALADAWHRPVTGIFAKAQDLMGKTELWEKKIKWPLELSKAVRSLTILALVALILPISCPW